jgi:prepilin-type N-terminal cleavage/methylation domain-containing protein
MKIKVNKSSSALNLIELLVVIAIIAILAALAVPALTSALAKAQMTGTMNNARQMYIAQFQMSNDGAATADNTSAWPGDLTLGAPPGAPPTTLLEYLNVLVGKGYLTGADALKLCSAPGASLTGTVTAATGTTPEALSAFGGRSALKFYLVSDANPASTIYAVSHNYVYNTALNAADTPYGTKGFIVVRKSGDAVVLREGQAQVAGWPGVVQFQNGVGMMPGDAVGTLGTEPGTVLTFP